MSALAELIEIVRHCDVQYLDQWYGPKANPEDIATELHDTIRSETFAIAADLVHAMADPRCTCGGCDSCAAREYAKELRRKAEEKDTATGGESTPDFFEVGRTYTEPGDTTDWKFRVDRVTTHPEDGERTALGWRHFHGEWEPYAYGEDDFEVHQVADAIGQEGGAR
ncbi:hypothetical protein [Streptomyces sp. NPDC058694]|uniref:hypothetical protein n=1 Tax=Streptomyces sp. NPDC058694 TaxID=3346603 RepID=UPI00365AD364